MGATRVFQITKDIRTSQSISTLKQLTAESPNSNASPNTCNNTSLPSCQHQRLSVENSSFSLSIKDCLEMSLGISTAHVFRVFLEINCKKIEGCRQSQSTKE